MRAPERAAYERVVLRGLHRILIEPGTQAPNPRRRGETHGGVRVERVYLDDSGPGREVGILFRDLGRPGCPFGYGIEAVETPDVLDEATSPYTDLVSAAQVWAETVWALFEEEVDAAGCGYPASIPAIPSPGYSGGFGAGPC